VRDAKPSAKVMADILLPLAQCYENSGDKAKAANAYRAYTALPGINDPNASYLRAFLVEDTDREGAIKMYEANVKQFPKDYRNFLQLGAIYAKDNATLKNAETSLRAAAALADTVAIIRELLGEVYDKLDNENGMLAAYTELLKLQPLHTVANRKVGAIQIKRKQFEAGIASLEKVATTTPDDLEARLLLATGYAQTNRHKEAAEHLLKAKTLKPEEVTIRLELIAALEKAGDEKRAREERRSLAELDNKIVAADKKNIDSRQRLITFSMSEKDVATAAKHLEELALLTPKDAKVFRRLYDIAMAQNQKKKAVEHLKKFIELEPSTVEAHKNLGLLLSEQKDLDGAAAAFRTARKIDPAIKGIYKEYMGILMAKGPEEEMLVVGRAAIAAGEADASMYAAMGDLLKKQKKFGEAATMYKGALETDTKNLDLLLSYAESQAKSGDVKNAAITYEQVVMLNPKAAEAFKAIGALQETLKNRDRSIEAYKKYLEMNPADEEVALIVGTHEFEKKAYKNAVSFLEMVKSPKLQELSYLANLGTAHFETGNFKQASVLFNRVRESKTARPAMLQQILKPLGICYEKENEPQKAAEAYAAYLALAGVVDPDISFKRAFLVEVSAPDEAIRSYTANVKAFPKDARNFVRLGLIYSQKKETLAQSAAMLATAVKLDDKSPDVWKVLAEVNGKLGKTDDELAALRKYAELNPTDFAVNRRIGDIYFGKKSYQEAITNLEMFMATSPGDIAVILMLVDAYENTKRPAKALELLEKARSLKGKDPSVLERLYTMYKQEKKGEQALKTITELASITGENKHRVLLFEELVAANKLDEAAKTADQIVAADPLNIESIMAVATVLRLQKKFAEAVESYKSALYIKNDHAPALYGRAEAHLALKEYDRAEQFLKRALEINPKMALAELGMARLNKARKNDALYQKHLNRARELDPADPQILEELKNLKK
jgi:tetratricopeptide (TPR) repeat protein